MEFLVEMTTRVPKGVTEDEVDDVRSREAAHSRELAEQGALLRLFRPPLQPGEWRTYGLFAADDEVRLEQVLASMPLRIWRTDAVTPLAPHPNDPGPGSVSTIDGPEFLVTFTPAIPEGTASSLIEDRNKQESERARELAEQGFLERLWKLPTEGRALGLYRARKAEELESVLAALPLADWLLIDTEQLDVHPSDPPLVLGQTNC
jgi:muconolactone delta-isomerase